jgi:hypothetical protein
MKKLIIIMLAAFLPAVLAAQETPLSSLYQSFTGETGFRCTEIVPGSTSFEWEKDLDASQVKEWMKDIESIRIVKYKAETGESKLDKAWKKMEKAAADDSYTEVINVKADDIAVNFYMIKGAEGTTREVALLEKDKDGIMMITMTGNMDFSSVFTHENMHAFREMGRYFMENKEGCSPENK